MPRVLMVSTISPTIDKFNRRNLQILRDMGLEVHIACNFKNYDATSKEDVERFQKEMEEEGIISHQIDFARKALDFGSHRAAYREMRELLATGFEFVHVHTPIAAAITRLAAKKCHVPVIYTAHGFHFYDGAPFLNWAIFYPVEKYLAPHTEVLITINQEDYRRAEKKFRPKQLRYVPGVGIDLAKFDSSSTKAHSIRQELSISDSTRLLVSIGELNVNKNHAVVLRALATLPENADFQYIICGVGDQKENLLALAKELGIEDRLHLLGFRRDVADILREADLFCFPSYREGLSVSVMEAMATGLPIFASRIRGNVDLIEEGINGRLFDPKNPEEAATVLQNLWENQSIWDTMGDSSRERVKKFSREIVDKKMREIYSSMLIGKDKAH